jgi:tyrosyl-tRNA synthetase
MFTFLPLDEIARLSALQGAEIRQAKRVLAYEATKITHGEAAAKEAESAALAAFGGQGELDAVPTTGVSPQTLDKGIALTAIMADVGLTQSRGAARRLIQQGGAYVNEQRIRDVNYMIGQADLAPDGIMLRAGKKKIHRIVVQE